MRPLLLALLVAAAAAAQPDPVRINQVGFYPDGPKVAAVVGAPAGPFTVRAVLDETVVFEGELGPASTWGPSGESVRLADFSELDAAGAYVLRVPGVGESAPFRIGSRVHTEVAEAALKAYYFMRVSEPVEAAYAGPWARPLGHADDAVLVHNSAATASRPAGTAIASPGGWYDAGDYNKYVVNSGISVGTLLLFHELYPAFARGLDVGIPESGDGVPDVLDEALVNVRWMLTMQDEDGGVYHKLTFADFSGEVMPHQATAPRYVVQKSTPATLDFAAVMAQAARAVAQYPAAFPGLADDLVEAAERAWDWAAANPSVAYQQWTLSGPAVNTGEYAVGGDTFADERDWAAWELFLTTRDAAYLEARPVPAAPTFGTPWWGGVREMGYFSLLAHRERLGPDVDGDALLEALLDQADRFLADLEGSAYGVVMGASAGQFNWGSNSHAANQGLALMVAHRLTGDERYRDAALANLDYLLGRNATGYSFVTGHGSRTPQDIHHRPSKADGVAAPVPGLLAGGPHAGGQDVGPASWQCPEYRTTPAASYVDDWCSYATNEITINWNAPLVFLAGALEAHERGLALPTAAGPDGVGLDVRAAPNPARGATTLRFRLEAPGAVTVRVFDALGREVARPLDGAARAAGAQAVGLEARGLAPGAYVVRVEAGGQAATGVLTVAR